uniref:Uncharacterized protein n=1 Tax=Arundo donax TaxID=35708 RepID=A0A0A9R1W1_ARUDO
MRRRRRTGEAKRPRLRAGGGVRSARDRLFVGQANRDGFLPRAARPPSLVKWWLVLVPSSLLLRW